MEILRGDMMERFGEVKRRLLDADMVVITPERLEGCFARYDREDIASALRVSAGLYSRLSRARGRALGYRYPERAENYAQKMLEELLH